MTTFTFLHEINDIIYAIRDCSNGINDAIQRGEVVEFGASAKEAQSGTTPVFDMYYNIRFDGDTFTTTIRPPFVFVSAQHLTEGQTNLDFDGLTGSPAVADPTEGSFAAGFGYLAGDVITLSDGSTVTVNTVVASGSPLVVGQVETFTVTTASKQAVEDGDTLTQLANAGTGGSPAGGVGVGFSLTLGDANLTFDGFLVQEVTTNTSVFDNKADAIAAYTALLP